METTPEGLGGGLGGRERGLYVNQGVKPEELLMEDMDADVSAVTWKLHAV